ncbi:MAG: DUF3857 domain-containing protein [Bacteroidetes bacterium]|nr:DUF3857 domain-containing protein [Bacteroidota bacterium]
MYSRVTAQTNTASFGSVTLEELSLKVCSIDTTADAVVLFDKGELLQFNDGTADLKIHIRIKLFRASAYNDWGNVRISALRSSVSKLKGATYYLEEGQIKKIELSEDHIFKAKDGKHFETINFTFPNLKEGSVVEYSYIIRLKSWAIPPWGFQSSVPTLWSSFKLIGKVNRYQEEIRGSLGLNTKYSTEEENTKTWVMTDIPAFKGEPLMPNGGIYKSAIRFWRRGLNWGTICTDIYESESFGGILEYPRFLKNTAAQITSGISEPVEKIKAISKYVKSNIKWDGTKDFLSDLPMDVLNRKTGTAGDINLIFGSLLKQAGISVTMVLLSTRDHGLVFQQFPSSNQFDYVICMARLENTTYLLDATERNLPFDVLPIRCLNYDGLSVDKQGGEWIKINSTTKVKKTVNASLAVTEAGVISGTLKISKDGYDAFLARESYQESGPEEYKKKLASGKSWVIEKSEIENYEDPNKAIKEEYVVQINDEATASGDILYVNPILLLKEESNPFAAQTREYPIDFVSPLERAYVLTLQIPEGYVVEELPQSRVIKLPNNDGRAFFNFSTANSKVFVTYNLLLSKTLFFKEEYPALKEFYAHLISKMSDQIVLRKKNK